MGYAISLVYARVRELNMVMTTSVIAFRNVIPTARDEVYTSYCLILGRVYWVKRMREFVKRSYQ